LESDDAAEKELDESANVEHKDHCRKGASVNYIDKVKVNLEEDEACS
jgi:hypothetical protein